MARFVWIAKGLIAPNGHWERISYINGLPLTFGSEEDAWINLLKPCSVQCDLEGSRLEAHVQSKLFEKRALLFIGMLAMFGRSTSAPSVVDDDDDDDLEVDTDSSSVVDVDAAEDYGPKPLPGTGHGTINWKQRQLIFEHTKCLASVRKRDKRACRMLTVHGPPSMIETAKAMAIGYILESQREAPGRGDDDWDDTPG